MQITIYRLNSFTGYSQNVNSFGIPKDGYLESLGH